MMAKRKRLTSIYQRLTSSLTFYLRLAFGFFKKLLFKIKGTRRLYIMLKRAFSTTSTNHNYQYHQATYPRWKARLCYGFLLLVLVTLAVLLIAWNMLCGLPSTSPLLASSDEEATKQLMPGESAGIGSDPVDSESIKRHTVQIYYEALCPDSRYFIVKEFNPAYNQLKNYIKPSFIPFGKASIKTNGDQVTFQCQHGETECQGNMIHSCAIAHVTNEEALVAYIGCMINNNRNPEEIGIQCANNLQIDWEPIRKCWQGAEGIQLLKTYGEMTHALSPPVSFIPTIEIDGSQKGQKEILKGLKPYLCKNSLANEKPKDCEDRMGKWRYSK